MSLRYVIIGEFGKESTSEAGKELSNKVIDGHLNDASAETIEVKQNSAALGVGLNCTFGEDATRKSKRNRTVSTKLDDRFQCDVKLKTTIGHTTATEIEAERRLGIRFHKLLGSMKSTTNIGNSASISSKDVVDLIGRKKNTPSKVLDALWKLARNILRVDENMKGRPRIDNLDTKFVASLTRLFSKFKKTQNHLQFSFTKCVIDGISGNGDVDRPHTYPDTDFLYIPFNFDKHHWVVSVNTNQISVLDPNVSITNEATLKRDLLPIATMMPYLLYHLSGEVVENTQTQLPAMEITRPAGIPQVTAIWDAGVMATLLVLRHATGGEEECRLIGCRTLDYEIQKLVVALLETYG